MSSDPLWPLYHGNMHKKSTFSERSLEHTLPLVAVVLTWWSVLAAESPVGAKDRGSSDIAGRCRVKSRAELRDHGCHSRNH